MATTKTSKQPAKKTTSATKTAAKKTTARATKAPAKKVAKKTTAKAAKKTTTVRKPVEVKARKVTAATKPGSFGRLADSAKSLASQAVSTAGALSHEVAQTATNLGSAAKTKAQSSVTRSKDFIRKHPGESAALAVAGLTVAASVLGRKRVGSLAKAAAVTGLASKVTRVAEKAGKLLKDVHSKL